MEDRWLAWQWTVGTDTHAQTHRRTHTQERRGQFLCCFCLFTGQDCHYEVPFTGLVQADPSFDEMKEVVVQKRMRPSIPNCWKSDEVHVSPRGKGEGRRMNGLVG